MTDEEAGEGGWFWNEQVGSFRPPGALYCRECGVLIQGKCVVYSIVVHDMRSRSMILEKTVR